MFSPLGMSEMVSINGAEGLLTAIARMSTDDGRTDKLIRDAIRQGLREAAKRLQSQARTGLQMQTDPRQAYKAVRSMVWKRLRGGNVSILQSRKAGSPGAAPANKRPNGNGRKRSERTTQLLTYKGKDRGFILRFLNAGTGDRVTKDGYRRGSISARNWFGNASRAELEKMAAEIEKVMDDIVNGIMI